MSAKGLKICFLIGLYNLNSNTTEIYLPMSSSHVMSFWHELLSYNDIFLILGVSSTSWPNKTAEYISLFCCRITYLVEIIKICQVCPLPYIHSHCITLRMAAKHSRFESRHSTYIGKNKFSILNKNNVCLFMCDVFMIL